MAERATGARHWMDAMPYTGLCLVLALLVTGCSIQRTQSVDPDANYALKFSEMPRPPAVVIHCRVERETPTLFGVPLETRITVWEFELVAAPSWIAALQPDFTPAKWAHVSLRKDLPTWFTPDSRRFSALYLKGPSGGVNAHLFVETAPEHPDQIRVFICRF